jgi:type IV pilus assembly protein PilN
MYSLDVNFLKDRPDIIKPPGGSNERQTTNPESMTPLFIGVAIGLLLPGLVGGLWFFMQQQNAQLEEQKVALNNQLGNLKQAEQQIKQLADETDKVKSETQALASIFNQIKPWSAMLQDIRERTPAGVQIGSIQQTQVVAANSAAPPAANAPKTGNKATNQPASPASTTQLEINGAARSFDEVNYLLLTLQRSSFLKKDDTQLIVAELKDYNKLERNLPQSPNQTGATVKYELPKYVGFTIKTNLSDVPASELIRELDRKGAVGLVTRIRTLQEKGVFPQ